jgi:SAM-dependent methyltransferase
MKPSGSFQIAGTALPLVTRTVAAAGTEVRLQSVPYSPGMLDQVARLRGLKERFWPYWLEEWPATYALAEALAEEPPSAEAGLALDLGCGTGFLAAFLRQRFGMRVVSCDFNYDACRLALINLSATPGPRPAVFCADFNAFPCKASFGLVLAGEMLYAQANHVPILDFLRERLAPRGTALLADPGRSAAMGFAAKAEAAGFRVLTRKLVSQAARRNVQVYRLTRA